MAMRVVALLATYNEERFVAGCVENLIRQGLQVYLIDNESTDDTVAIAERYAGRGLIGIETLPRAGVFSLRQQCARKETLAATLDADWFIHVDADQVVLPPRSTLSLVQALAEVEGQGYNAVNFDQFAFVPTQEAPDHDHPDYEQTMRWYYPQEEFYPHSLRAWKRQDVPVQLGWSAGHRVGFPGLRMYP
jgi:glycosyltransferase involved in cell wall biosynthesis